MDDVALSWPKSRLGEGLTRLVRASGLGAWEAAVPSPVEGLDVAAWVERAAAVLDVDAVPAKLGLKDLRKHVRSRSPSLVHLRRGGEDRFLLLAGGRRVLIADGNLVKWRENDATDVFITDDDRKEVAALLEGKAGAHLLRLQIASEITVEAWSFSPHPGAPLRELVRHARLGRLVALFASTYAVDYGLFVLSWWLLGRGALAGAVDWALLGAWAALFAAMLPFRMLATWSAGKIAVTAGGVLKKRLLAGAMRLATDELRAEGAGRHLARVFESEAVETLALTGGLLSAAATIELIVAAVVLSSAGVGLLSAALLVLFVALFAVLARRYHAERRSWTDERLEISHDLVERMVGHRTRLAQQRAELRHEGEDEALSSYVERSKRVDRLHALVQAVPRLWLAAAVLALSLFEGATIEAIAVGLGGAILASRALTKLVDGFSDLLDASIAWKRIAPLFRAAARKPAAVAGEAPSSNGALLEARGLSYRYSSSGRLVLRDVDLEVRRGDRILLESPSGGGKSTLLSLLNGLRSPSSGVVRIHGLDGGAPSDRARKVATAPQFHENHVFTESFAFNVLMGRRWPPRGADWKEAETVCRELGLGALLEKMPGGLNQVVGDTGWQLSHGERSRLFLARALLQGGSVVLLDESFAALDPENLKHAVLATLDRVESVIVVTHV